jgi:hypothetical protein
MEYLGVKNSEDSRSDFTRLNYRRILQIVTNTYRTGTIAQYKEESIQALWRHDVDYSPQAALALGTIENEEGVQSTYYFNMRSEFYNLFEPSVANIVQRLYLMGHEIGLHFDAMQSDVSTATKLEMSLEKECKIFETIFGIKVKSFSFHNPSELTNNFKDELYGGLINAYNNDLMSRFVYCSDSNGYWRFTPLEEFIRSNHSAICVLTHPGWWTDVPMSPRDRIVRCVEGRAKATLWQYDELLIKHGRKNIR